MNTSAVFTISNFLVIPMWALMIILPKWKWTNWLVQHKLVPILLAIAYATYIALAIGDGSKMDFSSLESVMTLFQDEKAVLAGWIHYLVFDLLVGMWILKQNEAIGIPQLLMGFCLIGCFMFGPIGFLLFTLFKVFKRD